MKCIMSMRARTLAGIAVAMMCISSLSSTSAAPEVHSRTSVASSTLTIGFLEVVDSLNPYVALNKAASILHGLVYDSLQSVGNDLTPQPNLARSWYALPSTDPDMNGMPYGSVWQYNLTRNATWSDGEPFTADDVVSNPGFNAISVTYPGLWAPWTTLPYTLWMYSSYKVDNFTVRISFWDRLTGIPTPVSYGSLISVPILPEHILSRYSLADITMNWTGIPMVGTGPFMATQDIYAEWLSGDHLTLVRNPSYHLIADENMSIKFDTLVLKFFQNQTEMRQALEDGTIDVASFPLSTYQAIKQDVRTGKIKDVVTFDGLSIDQSFTDISVCMNANSGGSTNPSRLDSAVRQAMGMAIDRQYIADNFYLGLAQAGSTIISPLTSWHYEPNATEKARFAYNLTAAIQLLLANGYSDVDGDGVRECTWQSSAVQNGLVVEGTKMNYSMIVRNNRPEEKAIATYLQIQWAQIGISLNYVIVDEAHFWTDIYSFKYDTALEDWSSDIDPNFMLFGLSSRAIGIWNDCDYSNWSYDSEYVASLEAMDPAERLQHVHSAQQVAYEDGPYIVAVYNYQTYAWRTDTFIGWGNWSSAPGRSIGNHWSANPLYFDLVPTSGPVPLYLVATPNPAMVYQKIVFNVSASHWNGSALTFTVEFGDGHNATAHSYGGTTGPQYVHVSHSYSKPGNYTLTVWVDDGSDSVHHNVSASLADWMGVRGLSLLGLSPLAVGVVVAAVAIIAIVAALLLKRSRNKKAGEANDLHRPPSPPPPIQ